VIESSKIVIPVSAIDDSTAHPISSSAGKPQFVELTLSRNLGKTVRRRFDILKK
jgi:hypothetical protein